MTAWRRRRQAAPVEFPFAERWNGRRWSLQHVPRVPGKRLLDLLSVSCPTADDCIAVGFAGNSDQSYTPVVVRWDGRR